MNDQLINMKYVMSALLYSSIGIGVLAISFLIFDKMTPQNLWKEIVEEKNIALAIFTASLMLGISQIIASAIHG